MAEFARALAALPAILAGFSQDPQAPMRTMQAYGAGHQIGQDMDSAEALQVMMAHDDPADAMAAVAAKGLRMNPTIAASLMQNRWKMDAAQALKLAEFVNQRALQYMKGQNAKDVANIGAGARVQSAQIGADATTGAAGINAGARRDAAKTAAGARVQAAQIGAGGRVAAAKAGKSEYVASEWDVQGRIDSLVRTRASIMGKLADPLTLNNQRADLETQLRAIDGELQKYRQVAMQPRAQVPPVAPLGGMTSFGGQAPPAGGGKDFRSLWRGGR